MASIEPGLGGWDGMAAQERGQLSESQAQVRWSEGSTFSCIYSCLLTLTFQELCVSGSKALFSVVCQS